MFCLLEQQLFAEAILRLASTQDIQLLDLYADTERPALLGTMAMSLRF